MRVGRSGRKMEDSERQKSLADFIYELCVQLAYKISISDLG